MKQTKIFLMLVALGALTFISFNLELKKQQEQSTDLEIYTSENIYYIKGLNVTDEAEGINYQFKTNEELKEFISTKTAEDRNENRYY